jgi:hypothetical protein
MYKSTVQWGGFMRKHGYFIFIASMVIGCSDYNINPKSDVIRGETGYGPGPHIQVTPSPIEFEPLAIGNQSVNVVEIANVGDETLEISGLYLHDQSGIFTTTSIGDSSLDVGEFTNIVVTYTPIDLSAQESIIEFYSNDPDVPTLEVPIIAAVLEPEILVTPLFHDFGVVGGTNDLTITVENVGLATLDVSSVAYYSTSSAELYLYDEGALSGGTGSLDPGASTELIVRFKPSDSSFEEGSIHIFSNDPDNQEASADQQGSGLPCEDQGFDDDFFVNVYNGQDVRLYTSNGDGSFNPFVSVNSSMAEEVAGGVVVGDFDGDGQHQILAKVRPDSSTNYRLVSFFYDSCDGGWVNEDVLSNVDFALVGAGDFDQDGDLDVYGYSAANNTGNVLTNDGSGGFTHDGNAFDITTVNTGYKMAGVYHSEDFNGDSFPDIAMLEYTGGGTSTVDIYTLAGDGTGGFAQPQLAGSIDSPANTLDFSDFDMDGWNDIIVGLDDDGDPGQVWIMNGNGTTFSAPTELLDVAPHIETGSDDCCSGALIAHDWTSDGVPDILAGFYTDIWSIPAIDLFENTGSNSTATGVNIVPPGEGTTARIASPIEH